MARWTWMVAVLVLAVPAAASVPRTEEQRYEVGVGVTNRCPGESLVVPDAPGTPCFLLVGGESEVTLTLVDDLLPRAAGLYGVTDASGAFYERGYFCDEVTLQLSPYAFAVKVWVGRFEGAYGFDPPEPVLCGQNVGTTGKVVAGFG